MNDSLQSSKSKSFATVLFGVVLGAIATIGTLSSQIKGINEAVQSVFPGLAPFNAAIVLSSPRITKGPALTTANFQGDASEDAVRFTIEHVISKTGTSEIKNCQTKLLIAQEDYNPDINVDQIGTNSWQQLTNQTFIVRRKVYSGQATLRMLCDRVVSSDINVDLPKLVINDPPQKTATKTTYVACVGEYASACGGGSQYLPCGTNAEKWIKSTHAAECKSIEGQMLSDVGGNNCGYATIQFTCTN